jgi:hypothetical protein
MAETTTNSALVVKQWDDNFFAEYIRDNRFSRYMGTDENSVIQIREDLTKKKGDQVTLPFVGRLDASQAATGNDVLEGAEQVLDNYGFAIPVDVQRTAVVVTEWEEQKSAIEIRNAARMMLKSWAMERMRGGSGASSKFGIIDNLQAIYDGTTYSLYADATTGAKNSWVVNNSDRVLFGTTVANYNATFATAFGNVDNTADKLSPGIVSLAKRIAKTADQHIRPVKTNEEEEWYTLFVTSQAFRDLKTDSTMTTANREGWQRYDGAARTGGSGTNPLFRDSDLVYDGVIIREIPEWQSVSNGSINCCIGALCGAQAAGVVWAQRTQSRVNQQGGSDYGFRHGVGVQEIRGARKLFFNNKQNGVVSVFVASVADA